jgi:hypothetical protein
MAAAYPVHGTERLQARSWVFGIRDQGTLAGMGREKKITVRVPADLLERARRESGEGITETVRQGLRLVAAEDTYRKLRKLRGKVKVAIDLKLRQDRG